MGNPLFAGVLFESAKNFFIRIVLPRSVTSLTNGGRPWRFDACRLITAAGRRVAVNARANPAHRLPMARDFRGNVERTSASAFKQAIIIIVGSVLQLANDHRALFSPKPSFSPLDIPPKSSFEDRDLRVGGPREYILRDTRFTR